MRKKGVAYILDAVTIPVIAAQTEIEEGVLESWLVYDQSFGLQSKVIVVEIYPDEEK